VEYEACLWTKVHDPPGIPNGPRFPFAFGTHTRAVPLPAGRSWGAAIPAFHPEIPAPHKLMQFTDCSVSPRLLHVVAEMVASIRNLHEQCWLGWLAGNCGPRSVILVTSFFALRVTPTVSFLHASLHARTMLAEIMRHLFALL